MLAPLAWRTPPRHYGPWEQFASLLTEGLVARGHEVTLFATADSVTSATLVGTSPRGWSEDDSIDPKVAECVHIASLFERADEFDIIHNGFDFLPLTYSGLVETPVVTTIHGFSSPAIVDVYERYDATTSYVAISDADRHPRLHYAATVHHGIDTGTFSVAAEPGEHLLYFGRIHPDKGTADAIEVARRSGRRLDIAGIIQDQAYFDSEIEPHVDGDQRPLPRPGRCVRPRRRPRRSTRPAPSHRLRRAVRIQRRRGDGVRHAGDRVLTRIDAGDRRGRKDRVSSSRTLLRAVEAVGAAAALDRATIRATAVRRFDVAAMVDRYVAVYRAITLDSPEIASSQGSVRAGRQVRDHVGVISQGVEGDGRFGSLGGRRWSISRCEG